jgi:hypothetical protein
MDTTTAQLLVNVAGGECSLVMGTSTYTLDPPCRTYFDVHDRLCSKGDSPRLVRGASCLYRSTNHGRKRGSMTNPLFELTLILLYTVHILFILLPIVAVRLEQLFRLQMKDIVFFGNVFFQVAEHAHDITELQIAATAYLIKVIPVEDNSRNIRKPHSKRLELRFGVTKVRVGIAS